MQRIASPDGFIAGEIEWNGIDWTARAWFVDDGRVAGEMSRFAPTHFRAECDLRALIIRVRRNFRGTIRRRRAARTAAALEGNAGARARRSR